MIAALLLAAGLTVAPMGSAIRDAREKPREVAAIGECAKRNADRLAEIGAQIAEEEGMLANAEARLRSWRLPSTRTIEAQRRTETRLIHEVEVARALLHTLTEARETLRLDDRC